MDQSKAVYYKKDCGEEYDIKKCQNSGVDLVTLAPEIVEAHSSVLIDLGVEVLHVDNSDPDAPLEEKRRLPGLVFPRSSIGKYNLLLMNSVGVIDAGYTGTLKANVFNPTTKPSVIPAGTALVQYVSFTGKPMEWKFINKIPDLCRQTKRGGKGFGSTGISGTSA
nr:Deoxyuridine triphosphate nucleotidohydrolase [Abalone asfa-like virus]